jgi:hypothetical protein
MPFEGYVPMLSKFVLAPFAAAIALTTYVSGASAEAFTTRIEPRPFYGATVTLEEGVRVIRPLPPERQVIINPGNATPLSLGFNETNVYENRTVRNYNYNESSGSSSGSYGSTGRYGFYGPSFGFGGHRDGHDMHHDGHGQGRVNGVPLGGAH